MTPQQLKSSLLQEAIQGKLTDQRPEDGSAEDLYRAILAEKKRLIKAGKLKKEKPLPPIEEKDIPFDIPENWKWVRLGEIFTPINGRAFKPSDWSQEGLPIVRIQNLNDNNAPFNYCNFEVEEKYNLYGGELLFGWSGTPGTSFGAHIWQNRRAVLNQHIFKMEFDEQLLSKRFLKYVLNVRVSLLIEKAHGAAGLRHVTKGVFEATTLPLPPLPEQERIVAKLEELLPLVERYGKAYTQLTALEQRFPASMRKSLLQEAIQGKLTDQRPEDGSAEELYRSILAEKKRLIKAGKLKKEKPLPPIEEKDIPFDIPENWKWVRLGEVFVHNTGKAQNATAPSTGGTMRKFITTSNLYWNSFDFSKVKEMLFTEAEIERCSARKGDLLVCEGGDFGRAAIWPYDEEICIQNHIHRIRPILKLVVKLYYHIFFLYKQTNLLQGRGVAIQGLSSGALHNLVIPLPPLAEQERIVAKLEELLPLCD